MTIYLFIAPPDKLLSFIDLSWLLTAINILLIFAMARVCISVTARLLKRISARYKERLGNDMHAFRRTETAITLATGLSKYVFYFIALALSVGELGLGSAMASMLAAAGIGTLTVGLGAQSIIGDMLAGLFMLFEDQIAVGDYVIIAGVEGFVEDVSLRTVTILGFNGERHIIPNGQVKEVTNFSRTDFKIFLDMEISRNADADKALAIMMEEAQKLYEISDDPARKPPERAGIIALQGTTITLRIIMHCSAVNQWTLERAARQACNKRFIEENIPAPEVINHIVHG